jgi:hypothetical protein
MASVDRLVRTDLIPNNGPGGAPIVYEKATKRIAYKDGDQEKRYVQGETVVELEEAYTATLEDAGKIFTAGAVASVVVTLPDADADSMGALYTLAATGLASSGTGHAFSPQAADQIIGNGFTAEADKDAVLIVASDRVGDLLTVVSLGNGSWLIEQVVGTWTREA